MQEGDNGTPLSGRGNGSSSASHVRGLRNGDEDSLSGILADLGPRLGALRRERGMSLSTLGAHVGSSASMLSRIETGDRRASLELVLRIALTYGITLDEVLGFPGYAGHEVPSERVIHTTDMVAWRLTRSTVTPQPYKVVYSPTDSVPPQPLPTHSGWKWVYVLSGRLRVRLRARDVVLESGEAMEIDTTEPHWTGSTGEGVTEILMLIGPAGERFVVR
ncbi:helix-turn-helix domain-containing protein [Mycolicibacterium baixiangningiae]|uniref:helix-turn-helix domain-containing protein n=1 Tax=Mycolicibacterium baixiangningiae TaxID=2761578 RepID=UPI00299F5E9E|nr:XRE family transcriptional regulator [Mycolicibacterium baixiangningiae]